MVSRSCDTGRPMSDETESLVRSGYAAFNGGERVPSLDHWHADGVYVNSAADPDPDTHEGIEAVREQYRRWVDAYPDLQVEPLEVRTNGDRAFVWVRFSGHGASSGVPIEMELAHVVTYEDGKIRRIDEYPDRAGGLEAAGIGQA
jgi:ketosteroid isomerase-like protein